MAPRRDTRIADPAEIRLLASPTRIDIVDTLAAIGGFASVARIADALGRPADGLYYHLRQLAGAGLIEEEASADGKRYRRRGSDGGKLALRYRPGATDNADAVARLAASVMRVAGRDFSRALAEPGTVAEGPRRELWVARSKGWVDGDDLAEVNRLLVRLGEILQRPRTRRGGKLVALSWVLAPMQPARGRPPAGRSRTR